MLIDSHCHLDYLDLADYAGDLEQLLQTAQAEGVGGLLTISVERSNIATVSAIAAERINVWGSVGVHPLHAVDLPSEDELLVWAEPRHIVALGETGLDYHYDTVSRETQQSSFRNHLRAARRAGLPVIIHSREASADTLTILREERVEANGGVLHCFTEDWEMAEQALEMNLYISLSGIVTFRNAESLRDVAKRVPLERLLVETDAPYLAPVPYRGRMNEPRYLPAVARRIAELRGISVEQVAAATTENFFRLFDRARHNG